MSDKRPEQSIASARASVMVYDDVHRKWIPSGSSHGLSKVHIYHHFLNNTFRVVGRKLQDHEVVINCAILKGLKYNQATPTFHQWRDNKQVYGLNFSSKDDAEVFATAMIKALEVLNSGGTLAMRAAPTPTQQQQQSQQQPQLLQLQQQPQSQPNNRQIQLQQQQINILQQQHQVPVYQQPHQHHQVNDAYEIYDEYGSNSGINNGSGSHSGGSGSHPSSIHYGSDGGYESSQIINNLAQQQQHEEMERRLSLQQQLSNGVQISSAPQQHPPQGPIHTVHSTPNMSICTPNPIPPPSTPPLQPQSQPTLSSPVSSHPSSRGSGVPPPPAPPPPPPGNLVGGPPSVLPPSAPMAPPSVGGIPPPPPPPMPNLSASQSSDPVGGLAAALASAKLKKTNAGKGGSSDGGKKEGLGGMASMMDEMQKTLARRRAKVDRADEEEASNESTRRHGFEKDSSPATGKYGNKSSSNSGSESPKPGRRRFGSVADEIDVSKLNGDSPAGSSHSSAEMEAMKQEILREMRKEVNKMKEEIIETIRSEMNRR